MGAGNIEDAAPGVLAELDHQLNRFWWVPGR